jgi:hypothetical protein
MGRLPTFVSPPWETPHGFWYVSGPAGCGAGETLLQALFRYLILLD